MPTITNRERLTLLYDKPEPFASFFWPVVDDDPGASAVAASRRLGELADSAMASGVSAEAIEAVSARIALPVFEDVGGRGVVAASDGTTIADAAHEGPAEPTLFVETLPYAAPFLEWDQMRVPHVVVDLAGEAIEEVGFELDRTPERRGLGTDPAAAAEVVASGVREEGVELVVVAGPEDRAEAFARDIALLLPARCEHAVVDPSTGLSVEEGVVRCVMDLVARRTVSLLREFRFLLSHDGATQGVEATLDLLARGAADVLLIHDDPDDTRRAWFGPGALDISAEPHPDRPHEGRLVDVAVRSALLQGATVHVVPSTGPQGPDGDIGALVRDAGQTVSSPIAAVEELR